jgi:hypothetical protein
VTRQDAPWHKRVSAPNTCDTPGHVLTRRGKKGQSPLNPKVQGSTPCASTKNASSIPMMGAIQCESRSRWGRRENRTRSDSLRVLSTHNSLLDGDPVLGLIGCCDPANRVAGYVFETV